MEILFTNKAVNKHVSVFNEAIRNIFSSFTPNKPVTFDDSYPPWMNDLIKNKIKWKHQIYETSIKNGCKESDYVKFQEAKSIVSEVIGRRKERILKSNSPQVK